MESIGLSGWVHPWGTPSLMVSSSFASTLASTTRDPSGPAPGYVRPGGIQSSVLVPFILGCLPSGLHFITQPYWENHGHFYPVLHLREFSWKIANYIRPPKPVWWGWVALGEDALCPRPAAHAPTRGDFYIFLISQ